LRFGAATAAVVTQGLAYGRALQVARRLQVGVTFPECRPEQQYPTAKLMSPGYAAWLQRGRSSAALSRWSTDLPTKVASMSGTGRCCLNTGAHPGARTGVLCAAAMLPMARRAGCLPELPS
jgi:hypothetical protein